jgi:hypothetical protein
MHIRDRIDVAVCIGSIRSDLITRGIRIGSWIQPIDAIVAELAADETRIGIIAANLHKIGNIEINEFHAPDDLAMIMAGVDRIECVLKGNTCARNVGLLECDNLQHGRFEQILDRAVVEFFEYRMVA